MVTQQLSWSKQSDDAPKQPSHGFYPCLSRDFRNSAKKKLRLQVEVHLKALAEETLSLNGDGGHDFL